MKKLQSPKPMCGKLATFAIVASAMLPLFAATNITENVKFAYPFNDGMVLQREKPIAVWGTAAAGERVTVTFAGQSVQTTAGADGRWLAHLAPMAASAEGRELAANGAVVKDVLVGEVWLCAGQSNMYMQMWSYTHVFQHGNRETNGYLDAAIVDEPNVRACTVPRTWSVQPKIPAQRLVWQRLQPGRQQALSAIAFHYSIILHHTLKVPVGVIVVASGATNIETWTSPDGFRSVPSLAAYAEKPLLSAPPPGTSKRDWDVLRAKNQPRAMWNGMIYPLVPFTFRGTLWYQGESSREQGIAYKEYLTALWNGWSKAFENPEMPFYLVQIAPYDYDMKPDDPRATDCDIWEAEAAFARENPYAGMVSIVDVGEHDNIHPGDKRTVAIRLAALALNRTYGRKDVPCDGPEVVSAAVKGDVVMLKFNHVRKWLMHGTDPAPFELAGADGKFVPATAKYMDGAVELRARGVAEPKQVRYLWNWCGKGRLKNDYGFPLAPFHMCSLVPALAGIDDPVKPWSYFVHPVTCIGMPLQTARTGIQVTPEGTVFTGEHELALFFGDERKPLACRQRRFVDDMPIVEDEWRDGACQYRWTLFGATLPCDPNNDNTAIFAWLEVRNVGTDAARPKIWASMKASGGFRREGRAPFNAAWYYKFSGDELWRGDEGRERLQVIYPAGAEAKFAAQGVPYEKPFTAEGIGIGAQTDAGIVLYHPNLKPGEVRSFIFKLPRAPTADATYLAQLRGADFEAEQWRVRDYWRKLLYSKSEILTPGEPNVASIHRQTAAHVLLASRNYGGKPQQTDALPYPMCFLTAQYEYQLLYHDFGWLKMFSAYLDRFTERQQPDGLFVDMSLSHGQKIFCGHGQPLSCICNTVVELEDRKLGEKYFPAVVRAVDCIRNDSDTQPHGLMRASIPYDNEMIKGQYTSHNYWSIIGLRAAIRLADFLGRGAEAKAWREFLAKYQALVLKAVRESADPDGYVPTGLYGFITGRAARHGFDEFRTDQDWENEMLLWPTELVQPGDPLVAGTLRRLHATKYREGIMSYRNGQHLHQYITCRAANQSIAEGDARNALIDFYHCIIHSGPAGESFENMIEPWNKRDVEFCPPPHAWGNANCNTLVRNLFLFERGDDTLYVLPALCRVWLKDGEPCGILRAPTRFGEVSVTLVPDARGATLTLDARWKRAPAHIYFRIPYFVKDWKGERVVELSPSEKSRRFEWRIDEAADHGLYAEILRRYRREPGHWKGKRSEMPPIPEAKLTPEEERTEIDLSFAGVLQAWRHEYALRRGARGEPTFNPVQMRAPSKAERAPRLAGDLLYRAKTTCSKDGERPAAAVDGFMGVKDYGYFECGVNGWWQADMGKVQDVSEITVIPYYRDAKRPYRFVAKTSVDGVNWTLHIDKRGNNQPFGAAGLTEKFQNTPMRYIRVENAGGNTVNKHLHLVEVLAK